MTESTRSPLVQPWDVIEIGGSDYLNGDGALRLRVIHVRAEAAYPNIEWIHLLGIRLHGNRDGQMMMVMVRAAALRRPGAVSRPATRSVDPATDGGTGRNGPE
ncbi:hypothetical protein [Micromonospora sp. LOL_021]|uniref:hypothetical protein n=1 Tax=Micromonospora sp. LOL_021 TaxID=3345417 RepID=UPI003A8C7DAC